jgi:hypothetical protein
LNTANQQNQTERENIMNTFVNNIDTPERSDWMGYNKDMTITDNGALSYSSSLNHNVDLFFRIGSARGQNLNKEFDLAFAEDQNIAVRMLQWVRDVRGGSGERQTFRSILKHMEANEKYHSALLRVIQKIPEIGRWDDMLIFETPEFKTFAYMIIETAIKQGNGLVCKWLPREKANRKEDTRIAKELAEFMKLTPRQYRKMLVAGTEVVENQMCAKQWDVIDFQDVPSVATRRYAKAFEKNASASYEKYLENVASGDVKINADAVFPYDLTSVATQHNATPVSIKAAGLQWDALPDYTNGKRILAMIDLSESMSSAVPNSKHSHRHMAISLGLYVAEKNKGAFKNVFLAFSDDPVIGFVSGDTLVDKYCSIANSVVAYSTDFQKAFDYILNHAKKNNVPNEEMPEIIIVPSDMQFNQTGSSETNFQALRTKYENAGYTMPKLVFWQMNGSKNDSPVRATQNNVSLISGFSPAILKAVLGDTDVLETPKEDPIETMKKALLVDRYDWN